MADFEFITQADIEQAEKEVGVPKFGPLGWISDYRTYRRHLPKLKRRETFFERNARTTNYNLSLAIGLQDTNELQEEAKLMYSFMNNFLAFPSGRTMWVGGTETSESNPACNFNCSFLAINRLSAFLTLFELLMVGTGVGYRVFAKDISELPTIKNIPTLAFEAYTPVTKKNRQEDTTKEVIKNGWKITAGDSRQGWVQALSYFLDAVFDNDGPESIVFNIDSIRPMGERINGFGGTASGPEALIGIIQDVCRIINECPTNYLRSIDCMDIADCVARGVVAGSSRRSALICLFDQGDELCANAKVNMPEHKSYRWQSNNTECVGSLHTDELKLFLEANPDSDLDTIINFIDQFKPSLEWFEKKFETIAASGEPGINNYLLMCAKRWLAVRKWRPNVPILEIWDLYCNVGTNPCHEIILSAGFSLIKELIGKGVSFCNLTTIPLQNFVFTFLEEQKDHYYSELEHRPKESYWTIATGSTKGWRFVKGVILDLALLEQAVRLITRIGLRQTCVQMPTQELHETQIEERLLGVSATGWRKMMDMLGWQTAGPEIIDLQKKMRQWANDEATKYAAKLGVPRPLLVTCIKPEGTSSKVFGSSDGLHWEWAPYYIRRIQMSTTDALAKALKAQGFIWHPVPYDLDKYVTGADTWDRIKVIEGMSETEKDELFTKSNAVQFSFPVKAAAKVSQGDVSAIEQLENVRSFALNYTDHLPSSTVTVKPNEWREVANWVHTNWKDYITAAFLAYWSGNYPLLPYEDITEEEYKQLVSSFDPQYVTPTGFKVDESLVNRFELNDLEDGVDIDDVDLGAGCDKLGCPIR